ncbi:hypothetical protein X801_07186, partial [Opisthorchis viverrini]
MGLTEVADHIFGRRFDTSKWPYLRIIIAVATHEALGLGILVGFWVGCYKFQPLRQIIYRAPDPIRASYDRGMAWSSHKLQRVPAYIKHRTDPQRLLISGAESFVLQFAPRRSVVVSTMFYTRTSPEEFPAKHGSPIELMPTATEIVEYILPGLGVTHHQRGSTLTERTKQNHHHLNGLRIHNYGHKSSCTAPKPTESISLLQFDCRWQSVTAIRLTIRCCITQIFGPTPDLGAFVRKYKEKKHISSFSEYRNSQWAFRDLLITVELLREVLPSSAIKIPSNL